MIASNLIGITLVVVSFVLGAWFWTLARSPSHLRHLLSDRAELTKFLDYLGHVQFLDEVRAIQPAFGSYARNIEIFNEAHLISLRQPRNLAVVLAAAVLVAAFFTGPIYCGICLLLFLVPAIYPLTASAKNNNITHTHTIMLNIGKWHHDDPAGCAEYCRNRRPNLTTLHDVVAAVSAER